MERIISATFLLFLSVMSASSLSMAQQDASPVSPSTIYFTLWEDSPGSIYKYDYTTGTPVIIYSRAAGKIGSLAFYPAVPSEKIYFTDLCDTKIFAIRFSDGKWGSEEVLFTHTTFVRDIAFDSRGETYFSEGSGAGGDGYIYRLDQGMAVLYFEVKLNDVDGFWSGDFTFDDQDNIYLSSGNVDTASIYKVEGGSVRKIFTLDEPISGFVYESYVALMETSGSVGVTIPKALVFTNWGTSIYCLDLTTRNLYRVYYDPERLFPSVLSDVTFTPRNGELPVGGFVLPVFKLNWLAVWIGLLGVVAAVAALVAVRKKQRN